MVAGGAVEAAGVGVARAGGRDTDFEEGQGGVVLTLSEVEAGVALDWEVLHGVFLSVWFGVWQRQWGDVDVAPQAWTPAPLLRVTRWGWPPDRRRC